MKQKYEVHIRDLDVHVQDLEEQLDAENQRGNETTRENDRLQAQVLLLRTKVREYPKQKKIIHNYY